MLIAKAPPEPPSPVTTTIIGVLSSDITAKFVAIAMKVCASELKKINVIDEVISEPVGGAHRDFDIVSANIKASLVNNLTILSKYSMDDLLQRRYKRLLDIGA